MATAEATKQDDTSDFERSILAEQLRKRRHESTWAVVIALGILGVIVAVWEAVHATGLIKPIFISDPISVAKAFWELVTTPSTWTDIWSTFEASIIGLAIGAALGIAGGIVLAGIPVLRRGMNPYLTLFNALPRPALAPIFILWFGLGEAPKVAVAVSIVFFVMLLNTMAGVSSVDSDIAFLARALSMSRWQRFHMVELPHALPTIVAGLRLGAVGAVLGVAVSEIVASYRGLGQLLVKATNQFAIPESFGVLALMALLAVILDLGVWLIQRNLSWTEGSRGPG